MNPGSSPPDVPALCVGWRMWSLHESADGLVLGSPTGSEPWQPGAEMRARCRTGKHTAPATDCSCGIHALRDADHTWPYARGDDFVVGCVGLWGSVVEGERGWRASLAYLLLLFCSPSISPEICHDLTDKYRIPVYPLPSDGFDLRPAAYLDWDVHTIMREIRDNADPATRDGDRLVAAMELLDAKLREIPFRRMFLPSKMPGRSIRVAPVLRWLVMPFMLVILLPWELGIHVLRAGYLRVRAMRWWFPAGAWSRWERLLAGVAAIAAAAAVFAEPLGAPWIGAVGVVAAVAFVVALVVVRLGRGRSETLANAEAARAGLSRCIELIELGRSEEAVAVYRQVVADHGTDPALELRVPVAVALVGQGVVLAELGRPKKALAIYRQVVADYGTDPAPKLREKVAQALVNQGIVHGDRGRAADAVSAFRQVVAEYGADPTPELRVQVAVALVNQGIVHGDRGRAADAVSAFRQVVAEYGGDPAPELRVQVASALVNQAVDLGELGRQEDALTINRQVAADYGTDPAPKLREHVARALVNHGRTLGELDRPEEALTLFRQVVADYGADPAPELREQVAAAMFDQGAYLHGLGRTEVALARYRQVVADYGADPAPELRDRVERARTRLRDAVR